METFEWVFRKDIGGRKEQQDNGCVFVQDKVLLAAYKGERRGSG